MFQRLVRLLGKQRSTRKGREAVGPETRADSDQPMPRGSASVDGPQSRIAAGASDARDAPGQDDINLIEATAQSRQGKRVYFDPFPAPPDEQPIAGATDEVRPAALPLSPAVHGSPQQTAAPDAHQAAVATDFGERTEPDISQVDPIPSSDAVQGLAIEREHDASDDDFFPGLDDFPDSAAGQLDDDDWQDADLDADLFDDAARSYTLPDTGRDGGLTRAEVAERHAIDLGCRYGWDDEGIAVLSEVFDRWYWTSAKGAMERALISGLDPSELELAVAVRQVWAAHPEFATDLSRIKSHERDREADARYKNLTWPLAIQVARVLDGSADAEAIDHILSDHFDSWFNSSRLRGLYPAFMDYLRYFLLLPDQQPRFRYEAGLEWTGGWND